MKVEEISNSISPLKVQPKLYIGSIWAFKDLSLTCCGLGQGKEKGRGKRYASKVTLLETNVNLSVQFKVAVTAQKDLGFL
jgi:hypothetical protein